MDSHWPENGLESVPDCPVCGSNQRKILYNNLTDQVFFCAPGTWSLHKCRDCCCAFLDPRPSPDTIHLAYSQYYTHTPPGETNIQAMGFLLRLRRSMANGYKNWRFAADLQPANRLGIPAAMIIPGLRRGQEHSLRHLPRWKPNARLLDVGFGSGAFLESAKSIGWEVAGVDPDPVSVESAVQRGLEVRQGGIEVYEDMPGCFDVITMNHVIEHVHDPYKTFQTVYHLLKPGGFLWLSTPNIASFGHEYYGMNWRGLESPRHLILFNWQGINALLKKAGFCFIQNVSSNRNFSSMAARSEALLKGVDPNIFSKIRLHHRLKGAITGVRTFFQPHRTEFITLKAYKTEN